MTWGFFSPLFQHALVIDLPFAGAGVVVEKGCCSEASSRRNAHFLLLNKHHSAASSPIPNEVVRQTNIKFALKQSILKLWNWKLNQPHLSFKAQIAILCSNLYTKFILQMLKVCFLRTVCFIYSRSEQVVCMVWSTFLIRSSSCRLYIDFCFGE